MFVLHLEKNHVNSFRKWNEYLKCFSCVPLSCTLMGNTFNILNIRCCMLQLGHNIEKVREKMRELAKQILHAYSATKSFPYILEGLRSKNNRTRIECADLVGFLIDQHGAEVQLDNLCCYSYWHFLLIITSIFSCFTDKWTVKVIANCCKLDCRTWWWN
jgi:hypothetical protein